MMARAVCLPRIRQFFFVLFLVAIATAPSARRVTADTRIHFTPHFTAGQVFHYSVQMHIDGASHSSGPVVDPEGPTKTGESVNVVLRLEVLKVSSTSAARIRVTYETAAANSTSDSYDADTAAIADQYKKLQGQSIDFTLESTGKITDVSGLKGLLDDQSRSAIVNQWLSQLTLGASVPKKGIALGEKWSTEQAIDNVPLAGLAWHIESTYVRDEPCPAVHSEPPVGAVAQQVTPSVVPDQCAVILTRSEITGAPAQRSNQQAAKSGQQPGQPTDRQTNRKTALRRFSAKTACAPSANGPAQATASPLSRSVPEWSSASRKPPRLTWTSPS